MLLSPTAVFKGYGHFCLEADPAPFREIKLALSEYVTYGSAAALASLFARWMPSLGWTEERVVEEFRSRYGAVPAYCRVPGAREFGLGWLAMLLDEEDPRYSSGESLVGTGPLSPEWLEAPWFLPWRILEARSILGAGPVSGRFARDVCARAVFEHICPADLLAEDYYDEDEDEGAPGDGARSLADLPPELRMRGAAILLEWEQAIDRAGAMYQRRLDEIARQGGWVLVWTERNESL